MVGVQERTVNVWDDKIKARVKVAGSGPALVFLHGGWGPRWTEFHDTLAREFTVYAPDHPGRLSRGLALVKWWLLAIPQYIIIGVFTGGEAWLGWRVGRPIPHAALTFSYNNWGLYYVGKGGLGSWG
ncbi:MAG: alpha/beta fold hydrolase [Streptosporangiaceae bacterium]